MPDVSLVSSYIGDAFIIGVIAFAQSVSMAKTLALKNHYTVDADQVSAQMSGCSSVMAYYLRSLLFCCCCLFGVLFLLVVGFCILFLCKHIYLRIVNMYLFIQMIHGIFTSEVWAIIKTLV